jgi:hypothetical protein
VEGSGRGLEPQLKFDPDTSVNLPSNWPIKARDEEEKTGQWAGECKLF